MAEKAAAERRSGLRCLGAAYLGMLIAVALPGKVDAAPLSTLEIRGKALYFAGTGGSGRPVKAYIGEESTAVDADTVPCAGCHGEDGHGEPEGGIVPGDITWSYLTKPYGHRHGHYRQHSAFTEKSLAAAVTKGIDPRGNRLDPAMPRFALDRSDAAALVAYLKRLDSEQVPGIDDAAIRVGTILPLSGVQQATGQDMRALLSAYFDEINAQGGIFNRKIELKVAEIGPSRQSALRGVRHLIDIDQVFAVVGAFAPGLDEAVAGLLEKSGVPLAGPLADFPLRDSRASFYLSEGIGSRARALLDYAASVLKLNAPKMAVVYPADHAYQRAAAAVDSAATARGWPRPIHLAYRTGPANLSEAMRGSSLREADMVFFLGPEDALDELAGSVDAQWQPYLFLAGAAAGNGLFDLPPMLLSRLYLALPFTPETAPANGLEALRAVQRKAGVGDRSVYPEAHAYAAARLLVEALKRSGRELSRKRLIAALESLHGVEAGAMPQLSYGPGRHVSPSAIQIASIDPAARRFRWVWSAGARP